MLDLTAHINGTGVLDTAEMRAQAEAFECRKPRSSEDLDLARLFQALATVEKVR
jgi:hypothetical protein